MPVLASSSTSKTYSWKYIIILILSRMPHGFISLSFNNNVGGTFTVKKSQRSYDTFSMHLPQSFNG